MTRPWLDGPASSPAHQGRPLPAGPRCIEPAQRQGQETGLQWRQLVTPTPCLPCRVAGHRKTQGGMGGPAQLRAGTSPSSRQRIFQPCASCVCQLFPAPPAHFRHQYLRTTPRTASVAPVLQADYPWVRLMCGGEVCRLVGVTGELM
jgi:hypothetical protein